MGLLLIKPRSVRVSSRILLAAVVFASNTAAVAGASEHYEVITSKAVYATRDGVALDARPAFVLKVRSFPEMMSDERSTLLSHEITLGIRAPRDPVMRPLRIGERPFEVQVSKGEHSSLLKKISPSAATVAASLALPLLVTDPVLLGIGTGAIVLTSTEEPLEEVVNEQERRDEKAAVPGRYALVDRHGRVIPSAGRLVERLPNGGAKDFVSYVVRHIRQPNSPSVFQGWLAKVVVQLSIDHFFPDGVKAKDIVFKKISGEFAGTAADLVVRDATGSDDGGGWGCAPIPQAPGIPYSLPTLCPNALTPSLAGISSAPIVSTSPQAVPAPIRAAAPEINTWFANGATAVRVVPVAPSTVTVTPQYRSSGGNGGNHGGGEHRATRHGPTGVELTGGFGGFTIDR